MESMRSTNKFPIETDQKKSENTRKGIILLIFSLLISLVSYFPSKILSSLGSLSYLSIISAISVIIGLLLIFTDRKSFIDKHKIFVEYAIVLYVVTILVKIASFFYIYQAYSAIDADVAIDNLKIYLLLVEIGVIFGYIALSFLVFWLLNKKWRNVLYLAIVMSIVGAFSRIYTQFSRLNVLKQTLINESSNKWPGLFSECLYPLNISVSIIFIITISLLLVAYIKTYLILKPESFPRWQM